MTENSGNNSQNTSSTDWMNVMADFWSPIMETWAPQPSESQRDHTSASLEEFVQMWQTIFKTAGESIQMEHVQQTSEVVPDAMMGLAQTCMRGFTRFQEQVNQWMDDKEAPLSIKDSEAFKQKLLNGWTEAYEKEFRQYLKIPQIGLGRIYQERVLKAADKHNLFQAAFSKFLNRLYQPMEEAFDQLQKMVVEHAKTEQVEEDPKAYYNEWIKILEGCYMNLFKKPDFSEVLGQTLVALNEYSVAKQAVVNDVLKQQAVPTQADLDELYKEIHLLKKRMRLYEKK